MGGVLTLAMTVLSELPALISAGRDVYGLIVSTNTTIKSAQAAGRDPTDDEWNALLALIADEKAAIDAAG